MGGGAPAFNEGGGLRDRGTFHSHAGTYGDSFLPYITSGISYSQSLAHTIASNTLNTAQPNSQHGGPSPLSAHTSLTPAGQLAGHHFEGTNIESSLYHAGPNSKTEAHSESRPHSQASDSTRQATATETKSNSGEQGSTGESSAAGGGGNHGGSSGDHSGDHGGGGSSAAGSQNNGTNTGELYNAQGVDTSWHNNPEIIGAAEGFRAAIAGGAHQPGGPGSSSSPHSQSGTSLDNTSQNQGYGTHDFSSGSWSKGGETTVTPNSAGGAYSGDNASLPDASRRGVMAR